MSCLVDELVAALEPFAALLQPHVSATASEGDDTGVFAINAAKITVGDLWQARAVLEQAKEHDCIPVEDVKDVAEQGHRYG